MIYLPHIHQIKHAHVRAHTHTWDMHKDMLYKDFPTQGVHAYFMKSQQIAVFRAWCLLLLLRPPAVSQQPVLDHCVHGRVWHKAAQRESSRLQH